MKNLLLKVSLKYGLILAGIHLVIGIVNPYKSIQGNLTQHILIPLIVTYVLFITFVVMAHNEFNKKNDDDISFKNAFLLGLIIIGITFLVAFIYSIFYYEFFSQEKTQFHLLKYLSSVAIGILIQIVVLYILIRFEEEWKKTPTPITDGYDERRCSVCNSIVISKVMAVQTGNFNQSDRTCYNCGTILCFSCAANEGYRRSGSGNTLNCPKCGANLNA
jgi:hypothetical protein